MLADSNTSKQKVSAGSVLRPGHAVLQKFLFNDRYHLTVSELAQVCPTMKNLMVQTTPFNCCRTSLLFLLLIILLKVRAAYFKADSSILGSLQCLLCSAGAPSTCASSTINFLDVGILFLDEVDPSRAVWCNYCLTVCAEAFSQLLKYFSKLLGR